MEVRVVRFDFGLAVMVREPDSALSSAVAMTALPERMRQVFSEAFFVDRSKS